MKKKKKRKAKLQANSRLGKMNESGPGVGSAKVGSVRWEVASIEFDDGCELGARDHCKLARPSAKPIIRTQDETGGRGSCVCPVEGRAAGLVGRQLIYYEHLTSILQGGFREAALIY